MLISSQKNEANHAAIKVLLALLINRGGGGGGGGGGENKYNPLWAPPKMANLSNIVTDHFR